MPEMAWTGTECQLWVGWQSRTDTLVCPDRFRRRTNGQAGVPVLLKPGSGQTDLLWNAHRLDFRGAKLQNSGMALEFTTDYVNDSLSLFRYYKKLGDGALQQTPDDALHITLDTESNSIATIVKHMTGNMRSRWTEFLTTDGEKPDRHRDTEFETPPKTRAELMALWEANWKLVFDALSPLTETDLGRKVPIRGEAHSVMQAINRQMGHYAYHVGQIVYLAKHFSGPDWKTLSVPRRKSAEFNARVASGEASQR